MRQLFPIGEAVADYSNAAVGGRWVTLEGELQFSCSSYTPTAPCDRYDSDVNRGCIATVLSGLEILEGVGAGGRLIWHSILCINKTNLCFNCTQLTKKTQLLRNSRLFPFFGSHIQDQIDLIEASLKPTPMHDRFHL